MEIGRHRPPSAEPSDPGANPETLPSSRTEIPLFGIRILTIDPTWLDPAAEISQQTGLLHNDALVIAVMRAHGLTNLASADPDFDRVPGISATRQFDLPLCS